MDVKCVASIDFTSLHTLKTFIRLVKEAGGSVSVSGDRPDNSSILDNPILFLNIESEILCSEIKNYASTINLETGKVILNLEISDKTEKSAACTLLESVANFTGSQHMRSKTV